MGQKNSELVGKVPEDQCPYRARAVSQGSNTRTGGGTPPWMLYQEVGATPSSMASAQCSLWVGALKKSSISARDAKKAYTQSFIDALGRPRTWLRLPKFLWPKSWFNADGSPKYKDPVCVLKRALCGHSESGPIWDKKMHNVMGLCGFEPVGEGSPGAIYHPGKNAEMIVYVDDFILVAPENHKDAIWKGLHKRILFKDPAAPVTRSLGVNHHFKRLKDGTCQMLTERREYLQAAVQEYMKEIGVSSLKWAPSPFIQDKFEPEYAHEGKQANTALSHLTTNVKQQAYLFVGREGARSVSCIQRAIHSSRRFTGLMPFWLKSHVTCGRKYFERGVPPRLDKISPGEEENYN